VTSIIRTPTLLFSIASALYWRGIEAFWGGLRSAYAVAYESSPPTVATWLVTVVPTIIYALICALFFHWVARRLAKKIYISKGE